MPRGSNFHKPYPPEFRREAVELVRGSGRPLREIAVDLGVSAETLRMWVTRVEVDAGRREGLTTEERAELRELRRKVKTLEQEREILKKARPNTLGSGSCAAARPTRPRAPAWRVRVAPRGSSD
jgi:transposase-like protein